jgi:hypothetical protein
MAAAAMAMVLTALISLIALAGRAASASPSGLPGRVPVTPDRAQARQWAVQELAGKEYADARPTLLERALTWLLDHQPKLPSGPGSPLLMVLLVALIALAGGYALQRSGGFRRAAARRAGGAVFGDPVLSAAEHRAAADAYVAAGDPSRAVLERFRAVARELEERVVLTPQPGRTADEVARDAAAALPELARALATGAELFDEVCYGGRPGTVAADQQLSDLDAAVRVAPTGSSAVRVTAMADDPAGPPR